MTEIELADLLGLAFEAYANAQYDGPPDHLPPESIRYLFRDVCRYSAARIFGYLVERDVLWSGREDQIKQAALSEELGRAFHEYRQTPRPVDGDRGQTIRHQYPSIYGYLAHRIMPLLEKNHD